MRKYLVILSLYLIPVFSCQGNNVVEPVKSIVPTPSQSIINYTPSPSIISSPSVLLTPSPMPSPSEMPITIDQAMIDYPDDYNQEESPKVIYSNPPIPESFKNDPSTITLYESGVVYDRKNNPVANADITILSPRGKNTESNSNFYNFYNLYLKTKTDSRGIYRFHTYGGFPINIFATKEGFTTRKISIVPNSIAERGGTDFYYFGTFSNPSGYNDNSVYLSINNEPEITNISINKQQVTKYNRNKITSINNQEVTSNVYKNVWPYLLNNYTELAKFKIKSIDKLEIEIKLNKSINKKSIEDNIQFKSLDGIDIYDNKTSNINFNWSDNNSKLNMIIPITKYNDDKKYRLDFKTQFTDSEGHQAYKGMYICLSNLYTYSDDELSENIVFSIAGNKGN